MNYCAANSRATYSVKLILKSLSKERKCKEPNVETFFFKHVFLKKAMPIN